MQITSQDGVVEPDIVVRDAVVLELKAHVGGFADAHLLQVRCNVRFQNFLIRTVLVTGQQPTKA